MIWRSLASCWRHRCRSGFCFSCLWNNRSSIFILKRHPVVLLRCQNKQITISTDVKYSLDLSCLLRAVCKSVFTDCRDISMLYYINHLDMVTTTTTKSWSPMRNSLDLSRLLCAVYINQSLLIAEIYQHSINSTILTWLRPPRVPRHCLQCEQSGSI